MLTVDSGLTGYYNTIIIPLTLLISSLITALFIYVKVKSYNDVSQVKRYSFSLDLESDKQTDIKFKANLEKFMIKIQYWKEINKIVMSLLANCIHITVVSKKDS